MNAQFITLDGIDGAGKSTHLDTICRWFAAQNLPILQTREPGGTRLGEALRELLLNPASRVDVRAETLLMFAARQQHLQEVIKPALAKGINVVCDRFTDATFAYQGGGRGVAQADIAVLENWVQSDFQPDLTLILDINLQAALARIHEAGRSQDRFEQEDVDFFERTRAVYLQRAQIAPQRYRVINSNRPKEEVCQEIEQALARLVCGVS
ncbi:dTMP kinase [Stenoxybacter acetivorans]|uniref:dTMP kinase n=1 Tax=Stenoxybacter acetivorans TaxID=422441 RepID=UPI0005676791|nr:dTMP kinase [Stenoxybacter acetivorans]